MLKGGFPRLDTVQKAAPRVLVQRPGVLKRNGAQGPWRLRLQIAPNGCERKASVFLFSKYTSTDEQPQEAMQRGRMHAGSVCEIVGEAWAIREPVGNPQLVVY